MLAGVFCSERFPFWLLFCYRSVRLWYIYKRITYCGELENWKCWWLLSALAFSLPLSNKVWWV